MVFHAEIQEGNLRRIVGAAGQSGISGQHLRPGCSSGR
jgi:hypothetical protein